MGEDGEEQSETGDVIKVAQLVFLFNFSTREVHFSYIHINACLPSFM